MRASDVGVSANLWGNGVGGESRDLDVEAMIFVGEWVRWAGRFRGRKEMQYLV
jgi:hypothetical protein